MEPWVPPPEFGLDGSAPPARSEPVREAYEYYAFKGARSPETSLVQNLLRNSAFLQMQGADGSYIMRPGDDVAYLEQAVRRLPTEDQQQAVVRRVETYWFWQRHGEVRQLPPGATSKTT